MIRAITIDGYKIEPDIYSDTRYSLDPDKYPFEGFWSIYAPDGSFIDQKNTLEGAKQLALDHIQADIMVSDLKKQGR